MIDLDAIGPVYRGHKLSRIVNEFDNGYLDGLYSPRVEHLMQWSLQKPVSTRAWARLDVRVSGNIWASDEELEWLDASSHPCYWSNTD